MSEPSHGELLRAFQDGDTAAFAALVDRFQGALLRYARFLPCGADGAEDVVQEAFLRLARRPPVLPAEVTGDRRLEQAHLTSWLFRVTRNCAMELVRSETRRRRRERATAARERTADRVPALVEEDTRRAIERGIELLPDGQREVVVLRLLGERTYREIAEITGKKPGTVAWLISEGIRALAERLAPSLDMHPATAATRHERGSLQ